MSTCTAPSAWTSGEVATGVDPVARQQRLAGGARSTRPPRRPAPSAGGRVGGQVELHGGVRPDDGADVAPLDDDAAVADRASYLRCMPDSRARTSGTALTGTTAALTSSERIAAGRPHRRRGSSGHGSVPDAIRARRSGPPAAAVVNVDAVAEHPPRHRAVHRSGVEVAQAEPLGDAAEVLDLPDPEVPSTATTTPSPRLGPALFTRCEPTGGSPIPWLPGRSAGARPGPPRRPARPDRCRGPGRGRCARPRC